METSDVQTWLDGYVDAWRTYERDSIEGLFTNDAEYSFHPYDAAPVRGAKAIADAWLAEKDSPGSWEASYRPHLIEGNRATAVGTTTYADGRIYWNIWELEFSPEGKVKRFVEWFMRQPGNGDA